LLQHHVAIRSNFAVATTRRRAVQPPPPSPCELKVLREPVFANWLAIDSDFIYVADYMAGLFRVPKAGLPPTFLAHVGAEIGPFAMDDTTIYFVTADDATTGSVYSVPKTGETPKLLATSLAAPIDIRVDSSFVYWVALGTFGADTIASDGSIERIGKDGNGRQVLADKLNTPLAMAIDDTDVYFGETGLAEGNASAGLRRVSKSGGAVTNLTNDDPVLAIATTATDVFYSDIQADIPNLLQLPKAGRTSSVLFTGLAADSIYIVDQTVYSAAVDAMQNTSIVAVPIGGGAMRIVRSVNLDMQALAFDDCAVYYVADSRLERAPR
jgi:Domain of unknown function (DUF5050)